ncbi:Panacea domain-containing protein [Bartonella sp. DGB1]|uniref:Panacea domain-containing protein n=1 Tax=Bartonella sp. DGB1 TaxID=3239807 RepID=UPI0035264F8A
MHEVQKIANFFLEKARTEDIYISPMKILKLVYLAYGWVIALTKKKLFSEKIEAWGHGPVIPSLYHEFKCYGNRSIANYSNIYDLDSGEIITPTLSKEERKSDTGKILNIVWESYKNYSAWQLREESHVAGSPWHKVYDCTNPYSNPPLEDEDIRTYFERTINVYIRESRKKQCH